MIGKSWRANVSMSLRTSEEGNAKQGDIRSQTNAIESLNYQFRKVTKIKGHSSIGTPLPSSCTSPCANAERKWKASPPGWRQAYLQFVAYFGEERTLRPNPKQVAHLLADLAITKTHSRPHVSNDNPFSSGRNRRVYQADRSAQRRANA